MRWRTPERPTARPTHLVLVPGLACTEDLFGPCHADSGLRSRWRSSSQGDEENQPQGVPVPSGNHPAGDLALCPVYPERKLLKKYGFVPDKLVTDDLRSYAAAAGQLGIAKRRERGQWRNNRAENSHQPTRRRERKMQGFKSPGSAQKFLSTHAAAYNTFNVQRHLTSAKTHRALTCSSTAPGLPARRRMVGPD